MKAKTQSGASTVLGFLLFYGAFMLSMFVIGTTARIAWILLKVGWDLVPILY